MGTSLSDALGPSSSLGMMRSTNAARSRSWASDSAVGVGVGVGCCASAATGTSAALAMTVRREISPSFSDILAMEQPVVNAARQNVPAQAPFPNRRGRRSPAYPAWYRERKLPACSDAAVRAAGRDPCTRSCARYSCPAACHPADRPCQRHRRAVRSQLAGMFQAIQCVTSSNDFPGCTSPSWKINANDIVPAGAPLHSICGEPPGGFAAQVYFSGISPPSL